MFRSLVFAVCLSVLAGALFAQSSKPSSAKGQERAGQASAGTTGHVVIKKDNAQTGHGGTGTVGQTGQEKPGEKRLTVLPRVRIVTVASDGSQIVVVQTFRFRTAESFPEQPAPRLGELVCPHFTPDGAVDRYGFDPRQPCAGPPSTLYTFEGSNPNQKTVKLARSAQVLNVPEAALRDRVKEIGVGSIVSVEMEPDGDHGTVRHLGIPRVAISAAWRFWTMLLVFVLLVIVAGLTWGWPRKGFHPFMAFLGKDNLYSNSKFQAALWFGLLIVTYVSALLFRWWNTSLPAGGVSIPMNLLMMSGLSALTFAGAKAIKQNQATQADTQAQAAERQAHLATIAAATSAQAAQDVGGVAPQVNQTAAIQHVAANAAQDMAQQKRVIADNFDTRNSKGVPRFWFDLTHNDDGTPSLSKFQLVIIVLIAVGIYVCQAWDFLSAMPLQAKITLPDVDSALLTAFGLGQGAYLGVKFASDGQ